MLQNILIICIITLKELSFGADSNGSGVAMLLELARIFSHLYANAQTHARVNLLFLLSGAGKLNYQGSKKWLEDQLDGVESSLLQVSFHIRIYYKNTLYRCYQVFIINRLCLDILNTFF